MERQLEMPRRQRRDQRHGNASENKQQDRGRRHQPLLGGSDISPRSVASRLVSTVMARSSAFLQASYSQ